jgi:hypothetical protein
MFRKFISYLFIFLFLCATSVGAADERFTVNLSSEYTFSATGSSQIRQDFAITNLTSKYLTSGYELVFPGDIPPELKGFDDKGKLTFQTEKQNSGTLVRVIFNTVAAGKDETKNFTLTFKGPNAFKHDNVWEVSLPKLATSENISQYLLKLTVPQSFGLLAYSTLPTGLATPDGATRNSTYTFTDAKAGEDGLTAVFGDFQTWGFRLDYQLVSPGSILLPSDTVGQKISLNSIEPKPDNISVNETGNWIAAYSGKPGQKTEVQVVGQIRLSASNSYRGTVPSPEIIAFSAPGIIPDPKFVRPYHSEITYDTYAASFPKISLRWDSPFQFVPWITNRTYLEISNSGNVASYSLPVTAKALNLDIRFDTNSIPVIPPLSTYRLPVTSVLPPSGLFLQKQVVFSSGNASITYNVPTQKLLLSYGLITIFFTITIMVSAALAHRAGSVHIQKRRGRSDLRGESQKP